MDLFKLICIKPANCLTSVTKIDYLNKTKTFSKLFLIFKKQFESTLNF